MFVAYAGDSAEPLTWADVKVQLRADDDTEQTFVEKYIIPAARQMAEAKTGTIIRKATFTESWDSVPAGLVPFAVSGVQSIESATAGGVALTSADYALVTIGNASYVRFTASKETVVVNYTAGVDIANYPGVAQWMLLACAWAYSQRELVVAGQSIAEMPGSYVDALLAPLMVAPKF